VLPCVALACSSPLVPCALPSSSYFFSWLRNPVADGLGDDAETSAEYVDQLREDLRSLEKTTKQFEKIVLDLLSHGVRPPKHLRKTYVRYATLLELTRKELQAVLPKKLSLRQSAFWDDLSFDWYRLCRFNRVQIRQISEFLLPEAVVCTDGCRLDRSRAFALFLGRCTLAGTLYQLQMIFGGNPGAKISKT